MTKKQPKAMLDSITESIDDGLQELLKVQLAHSCDFSGSIIFSM